MSMTEMPELNPEAPVLPVKDLILIRAIKVADTEIETPGGIIIPSMNADQKKYEYGEVVACGDGAFAGATGVRIPMDVVVGDQVAHIERAGWRFRHKGIEFRVIRELDVWVCLNADRPGRAEQLAEAQARTRSL